MYTLFDFLTHTKGLAYVVAGLLLVGIGIFDLWSNWDLIQTFLG